MSESVQHFSGERGQLTDRPAFAKPNETGLTVM